MSCDGLLPKTVRLRHESKARSAVKNPTHGSALQPIQRKETKWAKLLHATKNREEPHKSRLKFKKVRNSQRDGALI